MRNVLWYLCLVAFSASPLFGQAETTATRTVRILFIGNSYTYVNDLPRTLQLMAQADDSAVAVELGSVLVGGASLQQHWNAKAAIVQIRRGAWDYVVLQEQSLLPIENPDKLLAYGQRFGQEIRAAKAKPLVYLTWARKNRPASQDSLNRSLVRLANEIGAVIVPVGPAWQEVARLDSTLNLYDQDGSHPSALGSFVAAAAFYRIVFGKLPPTTFRTTAPSTARSPMMARTNALSPSMLRHVQQAVETAVARYPQQSRR